MRHVLSIFLILCVAAPAVQAGDLASSVNLFFIKRSKNANEGHYDASVSDCAWKPLAVDYYWRDLEDGPDDYEEIKFFEKPAYGFEITPVSDRLIKIELNALDKKTIDAQLSSIEAQLTLIEGGGCSVSVRTKINGKMADLRSVYVYATENLIGFPTVRYIEILGYSDNGEPVWQRVSIKNGRNIEPLRPLDSHWKSGAKPMGRG